MWLAIYTDLANEAARPRKRWLRPGRDYRVGRWSGSTANDLAIDVPNFFSRSFMVLHLSECTKESSEDTGQEDAKAYTLEVEVTGQSKKRGPLPIGREGQPDFLLAGSGEKWMAKTGDRVWLTETLILDFVWHDVVLHLGSVKGAELSNLTESLTSLGIRWSSRFTKTDSRPERSYQTHLYLPKFVGNLVTAWFAQNLRPIVSQAWVDDLVKAATFDREALGEAPEIVGKADKYGPFIEWNSRSHSYDDRWHGISDLENDFDAAWPYEAEAKYFPPAVGHSYGAEAHQWAPKEERRTLFEKTFIVMLRDYRNRELIDELVHAGGGGFLFYDLGNHLNKTASSCTAEIQAIQVAQNVDASADRKIVLLKPMPGVHDDLEIEKKVNALADGIAGRLDIKFYKNTQDIQQAVYLVTADELTNTQEAGALEALPVGAGPIVLPEASSSKNKNKQAPVAEEPPPEETPRRAEGSRVLASDSAPSTGAQDEPLASSQQAMPPPAEPVKRKLTRRAKTRNDDDMLDDILGLSSAAQSEATPSYGGAGSVPMDLDPASYDAPGSSSTRSRLKRRFASNATADTPAADTSPQAESADTQRTAKRTRSQSAEVDESASLGVPLPQRKRRLGTIAESSQATTFEASLESLPASKRKAPEESQMDVDEPEPSKAARKRARRRSPSADEEEVEPEAPKATGKATKGGKKGAKTAAEEQEDEEKKKYLAINTGRKKITEAERELNEEFNRLQVMKPLARLEVPKTESHKIKWNERDLDAEELKEMDDWTKLGAGDSFFRVRFFNFERKPKVQPIYDDGADARWAGMPNYKRFRPKNAAQAVPQRRRPEVQLELEDTEDYGVNSNYKNKSKGRIALAVVDSQPSQSQAISTAAKTQKGKGKGKAAATRARSQTLEFSDDSDDSDVAITTKLTGKKPAATRKPAKSTQSSSKSRTQQSQSQMRAASESESPPAKAPTRGRQVITLDDSDSDGGVFVGLDTAPAKGTKRKR